MKNVFTFDMLKDGTIIRSDKDIKLTDEDIKLKLLVEKVRLEVVNCLAKYDNDIKEMNDAAIRRAAENGHDKIVEYIKALKTLKE